MPRPGKTQSATATAAGATNESKYSSSTTSASVPVPTTSSATVRERKPAVSAAEKRGGTTTTTTTTTASTKPDNSSSSSSSSSSTDGPASSEESTAMPPSWTARNRWIVFAVASGACAAFNGVFAKLTTNELSTHIARSISGLFGLTHLQGVVEVVVRATFFGLNLAFNAVMWTLFTQALAKGNSTTQVSIMNTSTNFVVTALLGLAIFSESLPPLWWVGAALLVAGNVVIGRGGKHDESPETAADAVDDDDDGGEYRDYDDDDDYGDGGYNDNDFDVESAAELGRATGVAPQVEGVLPVEKDDEDEDFALLGDLS
ncbi:uncharacterized protein F4812DRAFT_417823 [Daldinia caldariorum]|uniref:uncharacterized protein n=1 Tax=Daldinia caldariorum TaxID=326644 RepID=UPI002007905D|nr:uncharacterized protein F4812DRAFT_417823 [Daldinia caldariorum]KAI1470495.1 hypothetical protein F4812DRAFT_417823 [Daldinia caldariorum]